MKRYLPVLAAGVLFAALYASPAKAEVNINIGIDIPAKKVKVVEAPAVIVIPGTYVYIAPDLDEDVFFYRGHWWKSHGRKWYRADDFGGPWIFISIERMPRALVHLPPHYRDHHPGLERIDHVHVKKNWRRWEKERHWDRHESWKEHKREHREHKEHKKHGRD